MATLQEEITALRTEGQHIRNGMLRTKAAESVVAREKKRVARDLTLDPTLLDQTLGKSPFAKRTGGDAGPGAIGALKNQTITCAVALSAMLGIASPTMAGGLADDRACSSE